MNDKQTLEQWFLECLKGADYMELSVKGHIILGISQKTWYNYRHSITKKIPASVAEKINSYLLDRGYPPYSFK